MMAVEHETGTWMFEQSLTYLNGYRTSVIDLTASILYVLTPKICSQSNRTVWFRASVVFVCSSMAVCICSVPHFYFAEFRLLLPVVFSDHCCVMLFAQV